MHKRNLGVRQLYLDLGPVGRFSVVTANGAIEQVETQLQRFGA